LNDPSGPVEAIIEVPRGGFVKRDLHSGIVDFVSPLPCPFNYGHVPGLQGEDGDPVDVVVLGPRRAVGSRVRLPVVAVVRFLDHDRRDDKWILADRQLAALTRIRLTAFFAFYARARRALDRLRGRPGEVRFEGIYGV